MKQVMLLVLFFFFFTSFVVAQTKIERYCKIVIKQKELSANVKVIFSSENEESFSSLKDSSELTKLKTVNTLTSALGVLNYMGNLGWKLIAVAPYHRRNNSNEFYFKKEFDKNDVK